MAHHPELRRKYGKYDFERFDHFPSLHASVGGDTIGKVQVDCRFMFKKSRWGVLGEMQNPAGIIYLDLNINQPKDCRLKSATITVTLDDDDKELDTLFRRSEMRQGCPVQLAPWYGPRQLTGQARHALKAKRNNITPHINVLGMAGMGGLGRDSEKTFLQESRWIFSGQMLSGKSSSAYKTLKWELTESELEVQSARSNVIHTAFSFQHDGQPIFMRVEVGGKLESRSDQVKHKLKKFPSNLKKKEHCATTLINFGGSDRFQKPLDELAKGLALAMEKENLQEIPIVVPNAQPVTFQEDGLGTEAVDIDAVSAVHHRRRQDPISDRRRQPLIDQSPSTLAQILGDTVVEHVSSTVDPTEPTTSNLASALVALTASPRSRASRSSRPHVVTPHSALQAQATEVSETSSATKVDASEKDDSLTSTSEGAHTRQSTPGADPEAVLALLQMSGFLTVVEVIVVFLRYCGLDLMPEQATSESNSKIKDELGGNELGNVQSVNGPTKDVNERV